MRLLKVIMAGSLFAVGTIAGCGPINRQYAEQSYQPSYRADYGVVEGIGYAQRSGPPSGAGAVVGGIAGGVLGHQSGSGRGNTATTIAGAIGGALVGNEIEKRSRREDEDYRISVRMDDGSYRTVIVPDDPHLRVGDRVVVEDGGRIYRR